jgi:hypothetical protein
MIPSKGRTMRKNTIRNAGHPKVPALEEEGALIVDPPSRSTEALTKDPTANKVTPGPKTIAA